MPESFFAKWSRVIRGMPLSLCGLRPNYSEGAIYAWECSKCGFREFGHEDEKPLCKRSCENPTP